MSFHLAVADNVRSLHDWHKQKHLLDWPACPMEPCDHLDVGFREIWSK